MTYERRSDDYEPGESGWVIRSDGLVEVNNVTINGNIERDT